MVHVTFNFLKLIILKHEQVLKIYLHPFIVIIIITIIIAIRVIVITIVVITIINMDFLLLFSSRIFWMVIYY